MPQPAPARSLPRSELGSAYLQHLARHGTDPAALTERVRADDLVAVAYGGRFLPAPVFLSAVERRVVAADLLTVYRLLRQLPERVFGGDVTGLARGVGMTEAQATVVQRAASGDAPLVPLARSDLYREAEGFRLLELNITSALGGFEGARINRAMLTHPVLAEFVAEHGLEYVDPLRGIVDTMLVECAAHIPDDRRAVVALVDWPESFQSYEPRLHVLAALLDGMGIDAIPCHVGHVRERDGHLEVEGRRIDVIFRFFLVEEIFTAADATFVEPVLRAVERGTVGLFSRLDAELYGNKGALAMLSDDRHRSAFSADERARIDRFLPWTRHVRRTVTDNGGEVVDLHTYALARREELVLKPTLLHGGAGVVAGWTVTAEEWEKRVNDAMDGPYVLQQRVRPLPEPFPADEAGRSQQLFPIWGVFLTDPAVTGDDGYNGCVVRASTDPDVGVISMSGGARVTCAFHEPGEHS
jgi:hypothetical protein